MADDRNRKGMENQIKGAGKEFKGKVQRKIGERQSDVDRDF